MNLQTKYGFIINQILTNINNRELVVWGENIEFENYFSEQYGIGIFKHLYWNKNLIDNKRNFSMQILQNNADKYYLVNFDVLPTSEKLCALFDFGFDFKRDLAFYLHEESICKGPIEHFKDDCNNEVFDCPKNCVIHFNGFNNSCRFVNVNTQESGLNIVIEEDENELLVNENTEICGRINIEASSATVNIGKNCKLGLSAFIYYNSKVIIGNDTTTVPSGLNIVAHPNREENIGNDCMFSNLCNVWGGDGHAIYDVVSKKLINDEKRSIKIGNHVWVGTQNLILTGADIGDGCIIGARSFVSKKYPNNAMIVGSPGKVVRKNVAWARNLISISIADCGEENIKLTKEENNNGDH